MTTIEISDLSHQLLQEKAKESGNTPSQLLEAILQDFYLSTELEKGMLDLKEGRVETFDLGKLKAEARLSFVQGVSSINHENGLITVSN